MDVLFGRLVPLGTLLIVLALVVLPSAQGASLQVAPISLEFAPRQQAQSVWLSNSGSTPVRAQVRVQQWSQGSQDDQLDATRDLVASPPMVDIAPGSRQMVRIMRLQPAAPDSEKSYRLIIDELPGATGDPAPAAGGLQFLLRYSVPVFIAVNEPLPSSGPVPPTDVSVLSATLEAGSPQALVVHNSGRQRVKINQLVHVDAAGVRTPLAPGLLGYVLAGQQMRWPLKLPAGQTLAAGGTFKAKFNADVEEQTLPLANTRR